MVHHITFSIRDVLSFLPEPQVPLYLGAKLHPIITRFHPVASTSLSLRHPFVYRSSSSRCYMMVHQRNNSFSKCSLRFFSKELKLSSSCNLECNSFFRINRGGIMSFLIIWVRVSWFTSCQEWDILNSSISSLELSWVIFHLKPSLRVVATYGAYKGPKFFFILPVKYFLVSLFLSIQFFFPWVAGCHLIVLRCIP